MATKTRADEMHDALVELYGPGSIADLLNKFYTDFPQSRPYLGSNWLNFIRAQGAVGPSHADVDFDFWKGRLYGLPATLKTAEAVWRAKDYSLATPQWLKDKSGHGHHMRLGSVGRADIIDGALVLPGTAGNYAGIADDNSLDVIGDITIDAEVALDNWLPAATTNLVGKADATSGYRLCILSTGEIRLTWGNGAAQLNRTSTAPIPPASAVNGQRLWIRASMEVDSIAAHDVRFYYSTDGVNWTKLGATISTAGATVIAVNAQELQLGANNNAELLAGRVYRARIYNGYYDGSFFGSSVPVLDVNFAGQKDGTPWFNETTGKRVTIVPKRAAVINSRYYSPGAIGQYVVTPYNPALAIIGDFECEAQITPDLFYTDTVNRTIAGSYSGVAATTSFLFQKTNGGGLLCYFSVGGVVAVRNNGSILPNGVTWVKVNRNATTGVTTFYYTTTASRPGADDWVQLGASIAGAAGALNAPVADLKIGAWGGGGSDPFLGTMGRVLIKDGIDGITVLDFDPSYWRDGEGYFPKNDGIGKYLKVVSDTTGTDTNDPTFLLYDGEKYVYLPGGTAGNVVAAPFANYPIGQRTFDLAAKVRFDNPASLSSDGIFGGESTFQQFRRNTNDTLQMVVLRNGDAAGLSPSSSGATLTSIGYMTGMWIWVRVVYSMFTGAGTYYYSFETDKKDAALVNWQILGPAVAGNTVDSTSIISGLGVGAGNSVGTSAILTGGIKQAKAIIDGITVIDVDYTLAIEPYATLVDRVGTVHTFNRSAAGKKLAVVDRPMFLFGADDYMECADHAALDFAVTDSLTVGVAMRKFGGSGNTFIGKRNNVGTPPGNAGWILRDQTTRMPMLIVDDGVASTFSLDPATGYVDGLAAVVGGRRDSGVDTVVAFADSVISANKTDTTTATLAGTNPVDIGRNPGGTQYFEGEFFGTSIHRSALTSAQIALLDAEYGTNA